MVDSSANPISSESSHFADNFVKYGQKLLEESEKPNVVTMDKFSKYIPLFKVDTNRLERDEAYERELKALSEEYFRRVAVNKHQPTIVIVSETDPREVAWLPRLLTRVASVDPEITKHRDQVPSVIPKTMGVTREQMIDNASLSDLVESNRSPSQMDYFNRIRVAEALLAKRFFENNLSESARKTVLGDTEISESSEPSIPTSAIILDDDDDD